MLYDESLDADAESTILLDAAQEVELPTLMVPAGDKADSSVSSLYNADFSGAPIKRCQRVSLNHDIQAWTAMGCTQSSCWGSSIRNHAAYSSSEVCHKDKRGVFNTMVLIGRQS